MPQQYSDFRSQYRSYLRDPDAFSLDEVDRMEKEAQKMGMIFRRQETSASLGSVVNNVWNGFVQGFTTLPVGDKPTNEIDGIFHSIGHLVGFIGGIPGVGTVGSLATKVGVKSTSLAGKALAKSIPMRAADLATDKLKKTAIAKTAVRSLDDIMGPRAEFGRQALRHGTHLGLASMTSEVWENMKDEDLPGFLVNSFMTGIQGGAFGATFAGIGNMPIPEAVKRMNLGRVSGQTALKAVAGGIVQTTPGALAGATTPENVYNALLGAYFGGKAKPWAYEKQYKRQLDPKDPMNETSFAWYKESNEFKNLSKVEQRAAQDVHDTFIKQQEAHSVIENIKGWWKEKTDTTPADPSKGTQRVAEVRPTHPKYGDKEALVIDDTGSVYSKILVDGIPEPIRIKKEFLRYKDEAPTSELTKDLELTSQQKVEAAETSPGETVDIPIVRPVENFLKKILKTNEITEDVYDRNISTLNRIIFERIEAAKSKPGDLAKAKRDLLIESATEIEAIKKEQGANELFELTRAVTDKNRIGNIRTRDPSMSESEGVGTRIVEAIKKEFIAKHDKKKNDKSYIEISPKPGSEGFWRKMNFKITGEKGEDGRPLYRYDLKKEIKDFEAEHSVSEKPAWLQVESEILTKFKKYGVTSEDVKELRNFYRRRTESIEVPRFALHKNKLVAEVEHDHNNNRITTLEPVKLIHRVAMNEGIVDKPSDAYFVVKNTVSYVPNKGKQIQKGIGEVSMGKDDYNKLVKLSAKKGYYPYSGKSDSGVFIFMKKNLGDFNSEKSRIFKDFTALDPQAIKEYTSLRKQAIENGGFTKREYDEMFVSNVRWWEAINGNINVKDIAKGEGFLKNVMHFNKRQQPLFSDYYSLTRDTFNKPFRYITVNDLRKSNDPATNKLLKWAQEHDDGAALVRMDLLDLMVKDMGLPENSGFAKPFLSSNQKDLGTLIGKLAFHGASPKLSQAMKEAGIDFIIPKSVAKQHGNRKLIDYNYDANKGKIGFSLKGKEIDPSKYTYEMLPEDIVVSWGVKDGSSKKMSEPVRVYKQIQEQFMNYDVQTRMKEEDLRIDINKAMNDFLTKRFEGDEKLNKSLSIYIKNGKRSEKHLAHLAKRFELLGAREIVDAMKDMTPAGESFRELVRKKAQRMSEEGMEESGIEAQTDWEGSFLKEKMTSAQALLASGGTRDAVALSKDLSSMMDQAITRYFLKRILQPRVLGAKGVMRTYSLDLAQRKNPEGNTSRLIKEEDVFFLDENFRAKPMKVLTPDGKIKNGTLGEQWAFYLKEPEGTVHKQRMLDRMRSIVVRTPIDSVSGLADLEFGGFTGIKGGGILLHPKIMKRLGGADLDFDTGMFYMNSLPKEFHKVGNAFKNDFTDIMKYADKKYKGYDNVVQRYIQKDKIEGRKSFMGMFDPYLRMRTASTIQNAGEIMRGIAVNAKTQIRMLYNVAKQSKAGKLVHIDSNGNKLEFVPKKDEMDLKLHGMAAVTVTVDVANYGQLVKPQKLKRILFESGFEGLYVTPKGSSKRIKVTGKKLEDFFNPWNKGINAKDSPIGEFANTVNKFFGKDWSTGSAWERRDIITAAENHPKWDNSVYSVLSNAIKKLDYSDSMFERYQYNTDAFADFASKMTRITRDNPEVTRYVKGDYRSTPFKYLTQRMNILSKYYSGDRSNQLAFNQKYNIARIEGIKAMSHSKEVFDNFIAQHVAKGEKHNFLTHRIVRTKDSKGNVVKKTERRKTFPSEKILNTPTGREMYLKKYIKQVNDYLSNDLRDLASLKTINDTGRMHGIKADSNLPRFREGMEVSSLNKYFMDLASRVKREFKEVYRSTRMEDEASPNQTALDRVNEILNGDGPASVKTRLNQAVEYLNANKRESDSDITYKGLREFFESYLLGSIKARGETESLYFVPQLISKPVLNRFNENMHSIFTLKGKRPTYSEIEKFFTQDKRAIAIEEAASLDAKVQEAEFFKPTIEVKDLSTEMQSAYNRILKKVQAHSETSGLTGENMHKFINGFFAARGKVDLRALDKWDLKGFEAFLDDLNRGGGFFRAFTRGGLSKYAGFWKEVDNQGFLKTARGFWFKMTETVAFEHMKNDVELIEKNVRGWKWVKVPDPDNPGKFIQKKQYGRYKTWAPTSHLNKLKTDTHGIAEYVSGMRQVLEEKIQETLGARVIEGATSRKNEIDGIFEIAWREIEANGSIQKVKDGFKATTENSLKTDDHIKFKKRLEDGIELYKELSTQKYRYTIDGKTKNYELREVLNSLKDKTIQVIKDTYAESVKLGDDFYMILNKSIEKGSGKKSIQTKDGKIDVTEIPIERLVTDIIEPLTSPGALVNKKTRRITLEEAHFFGRMTDIKLHSQEAWNNKTKKSVDIPEYDADYARTIKDLYTFKHIEHMFKDDKGKRISLFDNFKNPNGRRIPKEYIEKYLNNLLYMFNTDKLDRGWEKQWESDYKNALKSRRGPSRAMEIMQESYLAYKKYNKDNPDLVFNDVVSDILAPVKNYFSFENVPGRKGFVPWKKGRVDNVQEGEKYSQFLHDLALAERKISMPVYIRQKRIHDPWTGFQPIGFRENYMPHSGWDLPILKKELLGYADQINKTKNSPEERAKAHDQIIDRMTRLVEDSKKDDAGIADHARDSLLLRNLAGDRGIKHLSALGAGNRPGNMMSRDLNVDGYMRHLSSLGNYTGSIQQAIGTELTAVLSKKHIRNFTKKNPMGPHTQDWADFMRIYARDISGAPSTVSKEMLDSETLRIKNTPWWYTSDQYLYSKKSVYKLVDKLSGRSKESPFIRELYNKRLQGLTTNGQMDLFDPRQQLSYEQWWDRQKELFAVRYDAEGNPIKENMNFFSGKMKQYSQAEGKYQLATLLARMKVVVNNVFGGGTNAWVYNGARPMRDARKIEIWQSIDKRFKKMSDVNDWVYELGVVPEMIRYELGYMGMKRDPNWEAFSKDLGKLAIEKIRDTKRDQKKDFYDTKFTDLVRKYSIGSVAMEKAAWFMQSSELLLRTNTFKAGYLAIRDSMSPVEYSLNDPYLIQQAKKAVKASQFLYSAPFRPSFARTSAGKIYSRFKLWAWNSVKFRKDVYKEAKYRGFRPGSTEFERLQRMAIADLFIIGMAKLLPYTMFDYSLPAPYSYFQDTSDWLFGSDQQRERAFYGALPRAIAPLHEVMPSFLRGPEAILGNIFTGNWERFANYTLLSYFPFGLLGRDIYNGVQSPALATEFMTGIPLHKINRMKDDVLKDKKAPAYAPGFF